MNNMTFNEWLNEGEGWGVRRERMLEDIQVDPDNMNSLFKWLKAAYDAGHQVGFDIGYIFGDAEGYEDGSRECLMKG